MRLYECCELSLATWGASCLFGCNTVVGDDGMCHTCKDHSANMFECETCTRHWEDWGDGWEVTEPLSRTTEWDHEGDFRPGSDVTEGQ